MVVRKGVHSKLKPHFLIGNPRPRAYESKVLGITMLTSQTACESSYAPFLDFSIPGCISVELFVCHQELD